MTPHQLVDKWIQGLKEAGCTYDEMLTIFQNARKIHENRQSLKTHNSSLITK